MGVAREALVPGVRRALAYIDSLPTLPLPEIWNEKEFEQPKPNMNPFSPTPPFFGGDMRRIQFSSWRDRHPSKNILASPILHGLNFTLNVLSQTKNAIVPAIVRRISMRPTTTTEDTLTSYRIKQLQESGVKHEPEKTPRRTASHHIDNTIIVVRLVKKSSSLPKNHQKIEE